MKDTPVMKEYNEGEKMSSGFEPPTSWLQGNLLQLSYNHYQIAIELMNKVGYLATIVAFSLHLPQGREDPLEPGPDPVDLGVGHALADLIWDLES